MVVTDGSNCPDVDIVAGRTVAVVAADMRDEPESRSRGTS